MSVLLLALGCSQPPLVETPRAPGQFLYAGDFDVPVYSAPGGSLVQTLGLGDLVTVVGVEDGWVSVSNSGGNGVVQVEDLGLAAGSDTFSEGRWVVRFTEAGSPQLKQRVSWGDELLDLTLDLTITERFRGGTLQVEKDPLSGRLKVTQCGGPQEDATPPCATVFVRRAGESREDFHLLQVSPPDSWRWTRTAPKVVDCRHTTPMAIKATAPSSKLVIEERLPSGLGRRGERLHGSPDRVPCKTVGVVDGGPYAGLSLISCVEEHTKAGRQRYAHFIELGEDVWAHVACDDNASLDIAGLLPLYRVNVVDAGPVRAGGRFGPPEVLQSDANGRVVREDHYLGELPDDPMVAFTHPELGPVVRHTGNNGDFPSYGGLAVPHPEGGFVAYRWEPASLDITWTNGQKSGPETFRFAPRDRYWVLPNEDLSRYSVVGTLGEQRVFATGSPTPAIARYIASSGGRDAMVYVEDPFGGLVVLEHREAYFDWKWAPDAP